MLLFTHGLCECSNCSLRRATMSIIIPIMISEVKPRSKSSVSINHNMIMRQSRVSELCQRRGCPYLHALACSLGMIAIAVDEMHILYLPLYLPQHHIRCYHQHRHRGCCRRSPCCCRHSHYHCYSHHHLHR